MGPLLLIATAVLLDVVALLLGAAGVFLVWLYDSGLTFFYGAEVTQAYADAYGSRIRPDAVRRPSPRTDPIRR